MEPRAYSYIRFSTPEQEKGDSERRQSSRVEEIAQKLELSVDTSIKLTDRGLSAYKGDHRTKGALGEFLKLVDGGKIAVGSCLIIENLDRLTRQGMAEAINLLTGILLKGIDIYTVMDDRHFTAVKFDAMDLITSAIILQQGNIESEKKSKRLSEAWENKRNTISDKLRLTSKCPSWLNPKGYMHGKRFICTHYTENPVAVPVIKEIFRMRLDYGWGREKIARELNIKGVWTPPGRKRRNKDQQLIPSWRASYIEKILHNNRAVLGEYTPHKKINRKRTPIQEPIRNYFPQIIDEETYNRVQATFQKWDKIEKHQGGRNGLISNLFSKLASCSECSFPIQYVNKGYTTKGGQYLVCDKELRIVDGGCTKSKINYSLFEDYLLKYCAGLDVSDVIPSSKKRLSELADLNKHLQAVNFELSDINVKLPKIAEEIVSTSNETLKNVHRHNASRLALRQEELERDQKFTEGKISELNYSTQNSGQQLKDIQDLISRMKELEGPARIDLRLSLRNQLRQLIKNIVVHLDTKKAVIFFQSGQRRAINFITGKVSDAYPKSAGYIKTDKGFIKGQ